MKRLRANDPHLPTGTLKARSTPAVEPKTRHSAGTQTRRLAEELHVHQMELEIQNEELRRAQVELAQARDRLSDLYDFAPVGYLTLDRHAMVCEANLTASRMLAVPRNKLTGRSFARFLTRESQDSFYLHCRDVFNADKPLACELMICRADQITFPARMESVPFKTPSQPDYCHAALIDVTELHQSTTALRGLTAQLEQRVAERTREVRQLGALVEAAHDAIFTWTPEGKIQFWNAGAQHLLGYTAAEALGRPAAALVPAEIRQEWSDLCRRLLAGESLGPCETQRLHKDGRSLHVSVVHSAIRDGDGRILALASICRDISAQKEAEARRARYESQLRLLSHQIIEAEEGARRKFATALHDGLSQQLALLGLKLDGLVRAADQRQRARQLREMRAALTQAARAAHDLTFELFPPVLYQLGLLAALRWAADEMRHHHSLAVSIHGRGDVDRVPRDVQLIVFRCVRELLRNVARHARARRAKVHLTARPEALAVAVADDGRGFDPTHTGDRAPGAPAGGFGLFSIRERLEHLGGTFTIESTPGKGSTVRLIIPIQADESPAAQGSAQ